MLIVYRTGQKNCQEPTETFFIIWFYERKKVSWNWKKESHNKTLEKIGMFWENERTRNHLSLYTFCVCVWSIFMLNEM